MKNELTNCGRYLFHDLAELTVGGRRIGTIEDPLLETIDSACDRAVYIAGLQLDYLTGSGIEVGIRLE